MKVQIFGILIFAVKLTSSIAANEGETCANTADPCMNAGQTGGAPRPVSGTSLIQTKYRASKLHSDFSENSDDSDSQALEASTLTLQPKQLYTVGAAGDFSDLGKCIEHVKTQTTRHCRLLPGRHQVPDGGVSMDGVDQLVIDGDLSQGKPPVLDGTEPLLDLKWTQLHHGHIAADLKSLGGGIKIEELLVDGHAIQCRATNWVTKHRPCWVFDPSKRWAKQFSYDDAVVMATGISAPTTPATNKLGVRCWGGSKKVDPWNGVARPACGRTAGPCLRCGPHHACCSKSEVDFDKADKIGKDTSGRSTRRRSSRRRRSERNAPECMSVTWPREIGKDHICVEIAGETTTTTTTLNPESLPPFWFIENLQQIVVRNTSVAPKVRRVIKARDTAIKTTSDGIVRNLTLRGLQFLGTRFATATPQKGDNYDLHIEQCGFLYAPGSVDLVTTKRSGRYKGKYVSVQNSSFEFGLGALFYVATNAVIKGNYFAFNTLIKGGEGSSHSVTVYNRGVGSHFEENTLLYNGDAGGHNQWGAGNVNRRNLIVGSNWLHDWQDSACFHAVGSGQKHLQVIENWLLGPSNIKAVRLDTSKTTTLEDAGRYSTIRGNVWFGTDATTIKGVNHTVEHNTGDNLNIVTAWAAINGMNSQSYTRYNAATTIWSRLFSERAPVPGFAAANVCQNPAFCNPPAEPWVSPDWLKEQTSNRKLNSSVCDQLESCWENLPVIMGEGGEKGVTTGTVASSEGLKDKKPHEVPLVPLEQIEDLDFRPKSNSKLAWNVPASSRLGGKDSPQKVADSFIEGYRSELKQPSTFDTFAGAYAPAPNGDRWVPGCGGKPLPYTVLPLDAI